ncbi:MAG: hypothetical protein D6702_00260 [Planctomycetota bacterium]|nr:MAG: hypothetical protein D6702_00260 [Planctomycetota bacterium]
MPGRLRRRRRGGEGLVREAPETSALPLLEAACLEAEVPGALRLRPDLEAAGYWQAGLLDQWRLTAAVLGEHLAEAPDPLVPLRRLAASPDRRVLFHLPGAAAALFSDRLDLLLPLLRGLAAIPDRGLAEAVAAFGLRPLAENEGPAILAALHDWAEDPSPFVRRAPVEAFRPRGVWVRHLRWAVAEPALLLPLLERYRREEHRFPANAVGNCLNDIARDRPRLVLDLVHDWLHPDPAGPLARHVANRGLRGLVKRGDPAALRLLGFGPVEVTVAARLLGGEVVRPNTTLRFELELRNRGPAASARLVPTIETTGRIADRPRRRRGSGRTLRLPAADTLRVRCSERVFDTRAAPLLDGPGRVVFALNGREVAVVPFRVERGSV